MLEIIDEIRPRTQERAAFRFWTSIALGIACLVLLLIAVTWTTDAHAVPMAEAVAGNGAKITLHDDKCKLKEVSNLPRHATWFEKGKTFQGCWETHPYGVVVAYFDDGAVVIISVDEFKRVSGA